MGKWLALVLEALKLIRDILPSKARTAPPTAADRARQRQGAAEGEAARKASRQSWH